jgi:hypothetical protein
MRTVSAVLRNGVGLHFPAAVEDLRGIFADGPANFRRRQGVVSLFHAVGNLFGQILAIIFVRFALKHAAQSWGGVRVRGRHQHVVRGNAGCLAGALFRCVEDFARNHAAVHNDNGELGLAIVKHQTARV